MSVYLLDYGAGNVLSVINAIESLGCELHFVTCAEDFDKADKLIFPGVGSFGACMERLNKLGYVEPLKRYIASGKPYLGICLGLQVLFASSAESPGVQGLGVIESEISRFAVSDLAVPHIGWNGLNVRVPSPVFSPDTAHKYYFVHSFLALPTAGTKGWEAATTNYGVEYVSAVQRGQVYATQFHPEKSGKSGLALVNNFLQLTTESKHLPGELRADPLPTQLAPRIIACLDVRSNDAGDLVVTKGDQYDVREKSEGREVRNLGKPVSLAQRYYEEGADEVTFLNITSFRESPLSDQPMLEVLRNTSKQVFVPLTIGGGIRDTVDPDGTPHTALEVASEYFRSGADKVSIGSDAVIAAENYIKTGIKTGLTSIETISHMYGAQAVVISVDPRRVYVNAPEDTTHHTFETKTLGPNGEKYCWYECTIKGGREARDLDAWQLVTACEDLGAGEILLNCIDKDGSGTGFDIELIRDIKSAVNIPVIASSGAGCPEHFFEAITKGKADAALAAGIFHRREVPLGDVKSYLRGVSVPVR
eukprot:m.102755 g.102755  ORF g.102755 m.102755 type:complete len:534 (+) comp15530_c0_seq1:206-1807(+)